MKTKSPNSARNKDQKTKILNTIPDLIPPATPNVPNAWNRFQQDLVADGSVTGHDGKDFKAFAKAQYNSLSPEDRERLSQTPGDKEGGENFKQDGDDDELPRNLGR